MADIIVDAHIDMAYNAVVIGRDLLRSVTEIRAVEVVHPPPSALSGTSLVSLPNLIKGQVAIMGGSIFVSPAYKCWAQEPQVYRTVEEAYVQGVAQLDYYRRIADEQEQICVLQTESDLDEALGSWDTPQPRLGIFIVMEGAAPIREPGELEWWVERGLRGVGLTWSAGTQYAGGSSNPGRITDEGRKLLDAMADYNLMLDVSHMWEQAVYEVLDRYPGPLVATHANPRAFVDRPRQLSDDIIRRIAERGGVVGVTMYNPMLKSGWREGEPRLPLSRLVEAIDHICQITGHAESVGIGSDMDGGFGRESIPVEVDSVADLPKIGDLLRERGYTETDIAAILRENWLRVMREVLKGM